MYMVTDNARAHTHVNAACADTYMIYHVRIIRELQLLCTHNIIRHDCIFTCPHSTAMYNVCVGPVLSYIV